VATQQRVAIQRLIIQHQCGNACNWQMLMCSDWNVARVWRQGSAVAFKKVGLTLEGSAGQAEGGKACSHTGCMQLCGCCSFSQNSHRVYATCAFDSYKSWMHVTLGSVGVPAGCLCLTAATQTLLRVDTSIQAAPVEQGPGCNDGCVGVQH
jgi:hypothetical protein